MALRTLAALATAAAALAATVATPALAWEPRKPVDFVIMAGPGGGADQIARLMQATIAEMDLSPKPFVPVNKGGGSGAEALIHLNTTNDPDHTILVTLNSFFTTPLRQPNLGIDVMTFAPIARMAEDPFVLWVHKDEGITTFEQFLEQAKARGDGWVMGGTGRAQEDEIVTDWLNKTFDLNMKFIPYKGGGEVAKELAGKQITSTVNNPAEAIGFYQSGDVVPLLAFTNERLSTFPDVPTAIEKAPQPFAYFNQRAVVGAPGMSDEALAFYADVFKTLYESDRWQQYMADQSLIGEFITGDELKAYWQTMNDRHVEILKASGAIN